MKKILILTSGKKRGLGIFKLSKRDLNIDLSTGSFADVYFDSGSREIYIKGGGKISDFNVIYFRLVGKSLETAALVAEYAKKNRIKIVDRIYQRSQVFPVSQSKAQEMKSLGDAKISIPKTFFGSLSEIAGRCPTLFGFPFVVKSTSGKKGREVYSPRDKKELKKLMIGLTSEEEAGKRFFAQEYINCTRRIRVLVIGGKMVGSVSQLTKWRKRVSGYTPMDNEKKIDRYFPDRALETLAVSAVSAVGIDIAGVDVLIDETTGKYYVIEVNAAPSWKLIKKYCRVNVEYEILKYISQKV
jgi:RimK family alpha-L-glutamate ligase